MTDLPSLRCRGDGARCARRRRLRPWALYLASLGGATMVLLGAVLASERDERPGHPDEHFTLSAARQSGRFVAWRLDRFDGRVSACQRVGTPSVDCSDRSEPAGGVTGPFAVNAENSGAVGTLWVRRIDTPSGRLDYCSLLCCGDLVGVRPSCIKAVP